VGKAVIIRRLHENGRTRRIFTLQNSYKTVPNICESLIGHNMVSKDDKRMICHSFIT